MAGQDLGAAEVALVSYGMPIFPAKGLLCRGCHRAELLAVEALIGDLIHNDEMGLGIDGALHIVADGSLEAGSNAHNEADWRTADIFYSPAGTVAEGDSSQDPAGDRDAADASSSTPAAPFVGTNLGLFVVPGGAENAP
jgi:hypothetical protein